MKKQNLHVISCRKGPCESCNGTGEAFSDDSNSIKLEECKNCNGTGRVYQKANDGITLTINDLANEDEEEDFN